jgi:hypothetical protein
MFEKTGGTMLLEFISMFMILGVAWGVEAMFPRMRTE